ncbi:MAG TPA: PqqD family protein [Pyrinomonadaceae bacterium]
MSAQPGTIKTPPIGDLSFIANPEAVASIHDDGIVILHTGKGRLFSSNGTGARIWRGVERRLSPEAIAEEISGEYNIASATAREHTVRFLAELERHTLIQRGAVS